MVNPEFFADRDASSKYELYLKVEEAGYYMGHVKYNNQIIGPQWFGIISLTGKKILLYVLYVCMCVILLYTGKFTAILTKYHCKSQLFLCY